MKGNGYYMQINNGDIKDQKSSVIYFLLQLTMVFFMHFNQFKSAGDKRDKLHKT